MDIVREGQSSVCKVGANDYNKCLLNVNNAVLLGAPVVKAVWLKFFYRNKF